MKNQAELLRDEISRVIREHALEHPDAPTEFPRDLVDRVVAWVKGQRNHGITLAQCSERLNVSQARLHYWVYRRPRPAKSPGVALRPVQLSAEMVRVTDGVPEPRYTVRSPTGWEVKDLRLEELVQLLRSLH
jgi:hypothetical protein